MTDPLAEMVRLLQPMPSLSKLVEAAGLWSVRRTETGRPFYGAVLEGGCRLTVRGQEPILLEAGDFVLIPAAFDYTNASLRLPPGAEHEATRVEVAPGRVRLGDPEGEPEVRLLVGHCHFGSPDAALLVSLLPQIVHVRGEPRLTTLLQLVADEARATRPARDVILERLIEVMFIEALRATGGASASPGLLRGHADERLAQALRLMHGDPARAWTVAELADRAALSRTVFFERFRREVGVAPMEYLLHWRMALAKDLLHRRVCGLAEVAERVGYGSASSFSVAFTRHAGEPPTAYARRREAAE